MNRINPEPDETEPPQHAVCPYCETKLDITKGVTGNNPNERKPRPGDISICVSCGEPCRFDSDMAMVKLPDEIRSEVMSDPIIVKAIQLIKAYRNNPEEADAYAEQLNKMVADVRAWLKTGNWSPSIQYNFTDKIFVISDLASALDKHAISVNNDALIMFQSLGWLDNTKRMPTVFMVKMVMERVFKEKQ